MPKKRITVGEVERLFRVVWPILKRAPTRERILIGHAHPLLSRVSHAHPDAVGVYLRLQKAQTQFAKHGDSHSRGWLRKCAAKLKRILKELPPDEVDAGDIREAVSEISRLQQRLREPPLRVPPPRSGQPRKSDLFETLDDLAASNPDLQEPLQRFEDGLMRGHSVELRKAADSLKGLIQGVPRASQLQSHIETVTERALKQLPGAQAHSALLRFYRSFSDVPLGEPLRRDFEQHVLPAISRRPDLWQRIGDWVATMQPAASVHDARKRLVEPLRNRLAELVARDAPQYAKLFRRQENAARRLALAKGSPWEALTIHREIRASNLSGQLTWSYDDAILVINRETREVIPVLTTQVKSGDAASQKVLAQVHRDMRRESLKGFKIEINGIPYTVTYHETPPIRVVITTAMPEVLGAPRPRKRGQPTRAAGPPSLREQLRDAARGKPQIREAILRFEESYQAFDPAIVQTAADELKPLVPASLRGRIQLVADEVRAGQGVEFMPQLPATTFLDRLAEFFLAANGKMTY